MWRITNTSLTATLRASHVQLQNTEDNGRSSNSILVAKKDIQELARILTEFVNNNGEATTMKTKETTTKTAVLLIYETFPENVDLYLLPEDCEFLDTLRSCHGKYINSDEDKALKKLVEIMYGEDGTTSKLDEWKIPIQTNPYLVGDVKITEIIRTGMFL